MQAMRRRREAIEMQDVWAGFYMRDGDDERAPAESEMTRSRLPNFTAYWMAAQMTFQPILEKTVFFSPTLTRALLAVLLCAALILVPLRRQAKLRFTTQMGARWVLTKTHFIQIVEPEVAGSGCPCCCSCLDFNSGVCASAKGKQRSLEVLLCTCISVGLVVFDSSSIVPFDCEYS